MKFRRREFLKGIAAGTVASSLGSAARGEMNRGDKKSDRSASAKRLSSSPKNVILMICDDLGHGDPGCYGSPIPTPNLDLLARGGLRFTHHNTAHALCSASRAALLTGRYAPRSHTAGAYFPHSPTGMDLKETTLANLFKEKGYSTFALGKWHLGDAPEYLPTRRGFDHFYGVPYSVDMQPLPLLRDTTVLEEATDRDLLTQRYTQEAVRLLEKAGDSPFFMYLAYSYPHDPAKASPQFKGRTAFGEFGDSVHEIDWSVGQLYETLRRTGKLDETLILFTSDHGPWFLGNPGMLRGRKGTTFEGGHRVPMIMHWPDGLQPNQVFSKWSTHLDILPSLISWCGLSLPAAPLDGRDMSHTYQGGADVDDKQAVLYFNPLVSEGREIHCARKGDWKLRVAQVTGEMYINDRGVGREGFWLAHPELYNVRADPAESYEVARFHPEIVQSLLADIRRAVPTFPKDVIDMFAKLEANRDSPTTPPGAAPRPANQPPNPWSWEPPDRRS